VLEPPVDLKQPVLRAAGARVTMTPRELAEFWSWTGTDAELNDWFFGRMLAKDAVRAAWAEKHGERMFPADIETETGPDGRIVCRPRGGPGPEPLPPVSVAVASNTVAAFSAFAERVGIALVPLPKDGRPEAERAAREQAARLAVADALRVSPDGLALAALDLASGRAAVSLAPALSAHYPTLVGRPLRVQTARRKDLVVATTLCEAEAG
jgi:hypothetical protein